MPRLGVALLILVAMGVKAQDLTVEGRWAGDQSVLEVKAVDGRLSATVVALAEPNYLPDEEFGPAGTPRLDVQNPDEAMRDRPLLGMELLSEYSWDGKRWSGKIYDPESGNTYSSRMEVRKDGNLAMRGYIGSPLFGRTAVFEPVANCTPAIQKMVACGSGS